MWDRVVDAVTVVWLGIFVAGFLVTLGLAAEIVLWSFLAFFVVDLGVRYNRVRNLRRFVREQ